MILASTIAPTILSIMLGKERGCDPTEDADFTTVVHAATKVQESDRIAEGTAERMVALTELTAVPVGS